MPSTGSNLELRAYRVHKPAPAAQQAVLRALQFENMNVFYAIRSRVKPVESIIEKVIRRRTDKTSPKPEYEPENLTDVVGFRVVTLFREDVIEALRLFLQLIKHEGPYETSSPFVENKLRESIVYTTASVGDPEAITSRVRTVFDNAQFPLREGDIRQVETGYSSIHLIPIVECDDGHQMPIEVQIRTVFEDAWGEIDHKLRYSLKRDAGAESVDELLKSWTPHLNVLKAFADGCGQYAGVIKSQAIDARSRATKGLGPLLPVNNSKEALDQIGSISTTLRQALVDAYSKREEGIESQAKMSGSVDVSRIFMEAAGLFSKVYDLTVQENFETQDCRERAIFFARMERAFCLLSADGKAELDEAIQIYSEEQQKSPSSAVIYFRWGQALSSLGEFVLAEQKFRKASELLEHDENAPEGHLLHVNVPRSLGFALWSRSRQCGDDEQGKQKRASLLLEAYRQTKKGFQNAEKKSRLQAQAANNALYYGVEFRSLAKATDKRDIHKAELNKLLKILEDEVDLGAAPLSQINWLDTMCLAYEHLGEIEKAVLAAERIEHLLSKPRGEAEHGLNERESYYAVTGSLNAREREILDHALWVLRKHGPGPER